MTKKDYKKTILMTMLIVPLFTAGIAVGGIQNAYAGTFAIIINTPPTAAAQDVTKSANDQCLADVTPQEVDDGSSDPDGDAIILSLSPTGPFSLGNTPVTLTVTDDSGASDSATATVTVVDTTPPDITVPDGFMAIANTDGGWSGDIGQATATDVCDSDVDIKNNAPGVFPLGDTVVEWCATDDSGNVSCATQIINVKLLPVDIDIKPGSDPNSINPNSMGLVPVAILTTDIFDATTVDPSTLIFMAADDLIGDEDYRNCVRHGIEDVDGDGDLDLVCKFPQKTTWINCNTTQGVISGETFGGQFIVGFDSINPVGKECNNNNGD